MKVKVRKVYDTNGDVIVHPVGQPMPTILGNIEITNHPNPHFHEGRVPCLRLKERGQTRHFEMLLWDVKFRGITDDSIIFDGWEIEGKEFYKQRWSCEIVK